MTPRTRPPDSHRRSRRAGRRRHAATAVAMQATTSTKTTTRLPNSTSGCRRRAGVRWCWEQVGQSGQPSPESDSRTAAPVTTLSTTVARVTRQRRRNGRGPIRREDTVSSWYRPDRRRREPGPGTGRIPQCRSAGVGTTVWPMALPAVALPHRLSLGSRVGAYVALTKPRIIELLLITTLPTMIVAQRGLPPVWLMGATLLGGALAAGGANAINMFIDRDIDKLMHRTRKRPLVTGAVTPRSALIFAIALEVVAFVELWAWVNLLSAALAVSATLFYVFVYTLWLKRTSSQNIVIGGAAGAVPVLVGWAAVTDSLGWAPVVLFAVIFIWTPPHFWALAIKYREDYESAGVPMMPVVTTLKRTAGQIIVYTVLLVAVSVLFAVVGHMGALYLASALVLGTVFLVYAVRLRQLATPKAAMRLFQYSITYLTLLFAAMAGDVLVRFH